MKDVFIFLAGLSLLIFSFKTMSAYVKVDVLSRQLSDPNWRWGVRSGLLVLSIFGFVVAVALFVSLLP
ncbi:TPA: hypothetical protein UM365_001903 [Stenotrophomonas maltophilia]|uniref:hypothetical protein n=1 Tax=Stenotrophomonas maltophilia TaxID=40324 RepID=UPI0021C91C24|nr:hypothetical protein [Stenotrophomonas maltophilia]MCU0998361.1 hypothetical protein [Stenotrophomonas maltophilia]HEL4201064.1 hypothetical protein [Stenotrophomonas maltophilia]